MHCQDFMFQGCSILCPLEMELFPHPRCTDPQRARKTVRSRCMPKPSPPSTPHAAATARWWLRRDATPPGDTLASRTWAQRGASPAAPRSTPLPDCLGRAQLLRVVPPVSICPLLSHTQEPAVTTTLRCHRALSVSRPPPRPAGALSTCRPDGTPRLLASFVFESRGGLWRAAPHDGP